MNNVDNKCHIVYDKDYIQEGYILYREDYKKFIKVMHGYGDNYMIFANDEYQDNPLMSNNRWITLVIDSTSPLYEAFTILEKKVQNNRIFNSNSLEFGNTHLLLQKKDNTYEFSVIKDIAHKKNSCHNYAIMTIEDTPDRLLEQFYTSLEEVASYEKTDIVKQKMLNLVPTKK